MSAPLFKDAVRDGQSRIGNDKVAYGSTGLNKLPFAAKNVSPMFDDTVALVSWGEGRHNNHDAFEFSVRHGLRWFEIDVIWWMIRFLAVLGLATDVKVPSVAMRRRLTY